MICERYEKWISLFVRLSKRVQRAASCYFQEHPITILIVEDDITTLEIIKSVIKKQKFLPIPMSNGEDTLQFVESNTPDLILMDINLPGISGIETIRTIREQQQVKNVPIILLTAESGRDTIEAGLKLHVCGYILKPIKSNRLIQKIFSAITN